MTANETSTTGKTYTIIKTRRGKETSTTGTLAELIQHFSYSLECGNSYSSKIPTNPKTIKSLITALNNSADVRQRGSYSPTFYELG